MWAYPLGVCVLTEHFETGTLLLESGADCSSGKPSAEQIAQYIGDNSFISLFNTKIKEKVKRTKDLFKHCSLAVANLGHVSDNEGDQNLSPKTNSLLTFGDNGVDKLIRSVKNRCGKFAVFKECPGDLHAAGYANECMAKCLEPGGMFYCLASVLKRQNNAETYGKQKFQEGNLSTNAKGCRDIAIGYGLAAFLKFQTSPMFPSEEELNVPNKTLVYLRKFKEYLSMLEENDKCKYYLQAITLFGPWLHMYKLSVRNLSGIGRETVWLLSMFVYGQLQKNYFVCSFVHCVNFL